MTIYNLTFNKVIDQLILIFILFFIYFRAWFLKLFQELTLSDEGCLRLHVGTLTVGLRHSHGIAGSGCRVRLSTLAFLLARKHCFSRRGMDSWSEQSWLRNAKRRYPELRRNLWSCRRCSHRLASL